VKEKNRKEFKGISSKIKKKSAEGNFGIDQAGRKPARGRNPLRSGRLGGGESLKTLIKNIKKESQNKEGIDERGHCE